MQTKTTPVLTLFRTVVAVRGRNLLRLQRKVSPRCMLGNVVLKAAGSSRSLDAADYISHVSLREDREGFWEMEFERQTAQICYLKKHSGLVGVDAGGFLIIQDCAGYCGRGLLKTFINSALNREEDVHVLGIEVSEEELKDGLKDTQNQRLHFHNAYSDPLGWNDNTPFTVHQFCVEEITRLLRTSHSKPTTLVIDSLSWILRHNKCPTVCRTLHQLRKGGAARAVIALLHADMHQRGTVGSIGHLATSVITVGPGAKADEAVAKITKRLKSGKVIQDEEVFRLREDFTVVLPSRANQARPKHAELVEQETDPAANLTFNLRLSDSEREAKEKLALPFVFSKEKKSALLCSGPGSGQILYEPDANDDYDDEDPDDDLDV